MVGTLCYKYKHNRQLKKHSFTAFSSQPYYLPSVATEHQCCCTVVVGWYLSLSHKLNKFPSFFSKKFQVLNNSI